MIAHLDFADLGASVASSAAVAVAAVVAAAVVAAAAAEDSCPRSGTDLDPDPLFQPS